MSCLEIDIDKDAPEWSALTDNRDFKAIPSWDPIDRAVNDELVSESFLLDQKFLKYRSLIMRALATAVYISEDIHPSRTAAFNLSSKKKSTDTNNTINIIPSIFSDSERAFLLSPVLESLIEVLVQHQKEVHDDGSDFNVSNKCAFGPDTSRLTLYSKSSHIDILVTLLKLTNNVYKLVSTKDTKEQEGIKGVLSTLTETAMKKFQTMVTDTTEFLNNHETKFFQRHEKLEFIVNATESSCFAAILCGVCQVLLKSGNKFLLPNSANVDNICNSSHNSGKVSTGKASKKKGNKNSSITSIEFRKDLVDTYVVFNEMVSKLGECISSLLGLVEKFENIVASDELSALQTQFSTLGLTNNTEVAKKSNHCEKTSDKLSQNHALVNNKMTDEAEVYVNDLQQNTPLNNVLVDIQKQLENSYKISFLQIKTVIKNKQNYFSYLKCDTT